VSDLSWSDLCHRKRITSAPDREKASEDSGVSWRRYKCFYQVPGEAEKSALKHISKAAREGREAGGTDV